MVVAVAAEGEEEEVEEEDTVAKTTTTGERNRTTGPITSMATKITVVEVGTVGATPRTVTTIIAVPTVVPIVAPTVAPILHTDTTTRTIATTIIITIRIRMIYTTTTIPKRTVSPTLQW